MLPPYDPKHIKTLEDIKYLVKGPKKAVSAFLYFCNEQRQNSQEFVPSDFSRQVGEMWKNLPEDQKTVQRTPLISSSQTLIEISGYGSSRQDSFPKRKTSLGSCQW